MIYLDYQATTPVAPEVPAAMRPWLETNFANPHSPSRAGRQAAAAIEVAREEVLAALHLSAVRLDRVSTSVRSTEVHPKRLPLQAVEGLDTNGDRPEIEHPPFASSEVEKRTPEHVPGRLYFTSGATEAANWALKGAAVRLPPDRRRIVTLATEHACVLDTAEWLATQGFEIDILPVQPDGLVDLDLAAARIDRHTGLIAAMLVNNEIGVVQPIAALAALAHAAGGLFFCDAVQGFGRVDLPVESCDMIAISAHKVHGPKGIGALWLRDGVALDPLLHGGGQEGGLRSGTLSPALCVGFGEAARLLVERRAADHAHVERLWSVARDALGPGWTLNGSAEHRYRGNVNLRADRLDSARLISDLRQLAFSSGSACASGSGRPSHVLRALGLTDAEARASIRLGFGRYTAEEDLIEAAALIRAAAARQRSLAA